LEAFHSMILPREEKARGTSGPEANEAMRDRKVSEAVTQVRKIEIRSCVKIQVN